MSNETKHDALTLAHIAIEALIHAEQNPHSDRIAQKASDAVWAARKARREVLEAREND